MCGNLQTPASGDLGALVSRVLALPGCEDLRLICTRTGCDVRRWHVAREDWLVGRGATPADALRALLEKREAFEARTPRRKSSLPRFLSA